MLTPGKAIPFYPPHDGVQPALCIACCHCPTLSTSHLLDRYWLSPEAAHG